MNYYQQQKSCLQRSEKIDHFNLKEITWKHKQSNTMNKGRNVNAVNNPVTMATEATALAKKE